MKRRNNQVVIGFRKMGKLRGVWRSDLLWTLFLAGSAFILQPGVEAWSKEGHIMTCEIAEDLLEAETARAIRKLLPDYAHGNLSSLCAWADTVRFRYRWSSHLHYINTPDQLCNYDYDRDCHDQYGIKGRCVAGAIKNYTDQLTDYRDGTDHQHNMTEALLFLAHYVGDIHQPLHVGFTSDEGGNTIEVRWFRHKSNLHHVWDREIILTAAKDYYERDMGLLEEDIKRNLTDGIWSDEIPAWRRCRNLFTCINKYASESIDLACRWAYKGVQPGDTLSDDYFNSRMPIVMERIAQGGVRLAMILNRIFGNSDQVFSEDNFLSDILGKMKDLFLE